MGIFFSNSTWNLLLIQHLELHASATMTKNVNVCGWLCIKTELPAFLISLKSQPSKHITDNRTEQGEAQTLASFTGERTSPYLFISSALWPKYLAKSLLQKRMTKARPPYPRLTLARLIKMRITCTKHSEGDKGKQIEKAVGTFT